MSSLDEKLPPAPATPTDGAEPTAAPTTELDAPIKLVIWDLDETLWDGTLSEGQVVLDPSRAELVRELNRRGIVNSICSKNDPDAARERLIGEDIWEQFVFPSINWSPKGQRIAQIIEDMQLRAENVLFLDDNVGNLEEARYYAASIQVAGPAAIDDLLSQPQLKGKDDRGLSRLRQYQLLERKAVDRSATEDSNEDFLRSCDIHVQLGEDCERESARLVELMNRTNQLNFTKRRVTAEEWDAMLADERRVTRYVRVRDRYGDYGICGLYSLREGQLTDFVFSCRILHMGVEQWIYNRLGRPPMEIVGEVAATVGEQEVDWISLLDDEDDTPAPQKNRVGLSSASTMLLKGGCDLEAVNDFLGGSLQTEFSFTGPSGALIHWHHTQILRQSTRDVRSEFGSTIDRLPFLDRVAYESRLIDSPESFGTVIYSLIMDYTQGLYRLRGTDFIAPFEQYNRDLTDPDCWPDIDEQYGPNGVDRTFLEWFSEQFEFLGAPSIGAFQDNVRWLADLLPASQLILLNAPEVELGHEREQDRHLHHRRLNEALDDVVTELPNAVICDLRQIVTSPSDVTVNIRHYTRRVYLQIAEALQQLVEDGEFEIERRVLIRNVRRYRSRLGRAVQRRRVR
jgi:FkbH-like protein